MFDSILAPFFQQMIWQALLVTLALSFIAIVASTLLGLVLAFLRSSPVKAISTGVLLAGSIFRDTPLLLQMMFWYFGGPQLIPAPLMAWLNSNHDIAIFGVQVGWPSYEFIAACFALTTYSAFFIAEDIRSGILGVPLAQREAALALGMRPAQALLYVVLPQAWRIALPALFGQYTNVVKNSSLAMGIGVMEISNAAFKINDETGKTFVAFGVATVIYVGVNVLVNIWASLRTREALRVA